MNINEAKKLLWQQYRHWPGFMGVGSHYTIDEESQTAYKHLIISVNDPKCEIAREFAKNPVFAGCPVKVELDWVIDEDYRGEPE